MTERNQGFCLSTCILRTVVFVRYLLRQPFQYLGENLLSKSISWVKKMNVTPSETRKRLQIQYKS